MNRNTLKTVRMCRLNRFLRLKTLKYDIPNQIKLKFRPETQDVGPLCLKMCRFQDTTVAFLTQNAIKMVEICLKYAFFWVKSIQDQESEPAGGHLTAGCVAENSNIRCRVPLADQVPPRRSGAKRPLTSCAFN